MRPLSLTVVPWAIAYTLALLGACGGPQQQITTVPSKPQKPDWIMNLPREAGYAYVVGVKTRAPTLEDGKSGAHQSATVQVSNVVGTQVKSAAESKMSTEGVNYSAEEIAARTQAFIKSLVQVDEYYEKTTKLVGSYYEETYDVWTLAKFPLAAADEERKRQAAEHAEIGRDAVKRYHDGMAEKSGGNARQAWISLSQAKRLLGDVPVLTELHDGGYDTAADLLRAIDKDLLALDELARGVRVELAVKGQLSDEADKSVTAALSQALSTTRVLLRKNGDARFVLHLDVSTQVPKKKVMGQQVAYLTYAGNLTDTWSGGALSAGNGEVKGFGKTPEAAVGEAAKEAAGKVASAAAATVDEALTKDSEI